MPSSETVESIAHRTNGAVRFLLLCLFLSPWMAARPSGEEQTLGNWTHQGLKPGFQNLLAVPLSLSVPVCKTGEIIATALGCFED